jgi:hypothetical protein
MNSRIFAVLITTATFGMLLVAAAYFDVSWLLIGGIEQIVHSAQQHPVNIAGIVWGAIRAASFGIVTFCVGASTACLLRRSNKLEEQVRRQ